MSRYEPGSTSTSSPGVHCGTSRTPTGDPALPASDSAPASVAVSSPDRVSVIVSRLITRRDNTSPRPSRRLVNFSICAHSSAIPSRAAASRRSSSSSTTPSPPPTPSWNSTIRRPTENGTVVRVRSIRNGDTRPHVHGKLREYVALEFSRPACWQFAPTGCRRPSHAATLWGTVSRQLAGGGRMHDDAAMRSGPSGGRADGMFSVLLDIAPGPELDLEELERLARHLRAEIADLDVESVRPGLGGTAPTGAKGTGAVTLGAVVVALSASGGVFTALVETPRDWLGRSSARHRVSLAIDGDTIALERATTAERRDLIDAYIRRHTGG